MRRLQNELKLKSEIRSDAPRLGVVYLKIKEGKTYKDIGKMLGITAQKARKLYLKYEEEKKLKIYDDETFMWIQKHDSIKSYKDESATSCLSRTLRKLREEEKEKNNWLECCKDLQREVWSLRKQIDLLNEHIRKLEGAENG